MNAELKATVSQLGETAFDPQASPEKRAQAAWALMKILVHEQNDLQKKVMPQAWNEALDRASDLIGELADKENAKHLALVGKNQDGDKEKHAAISLNAAAVSLSTLKRTVD